MPINPQNLMPNFAPLAPLGPLDFGASQGTGMQRKQLQLLREQFEETKRKNREDAELSRMRIAADQRQAEMVLEQQKQKAAQLAAAALREQKEAAYTDFFKAKDARDYAGMDAAALRLREHGGLGEFVGRDAEGNPSYRVAVDADEYHAQERALQEQATNEQGAYGSMEEGMGAEPSALVQSLDSLNAFRGNRLVDMGEQKRISQAQLGPVLESMKLSRPQGPHQDSSGHVNQGVLSLAPSPAKGVEMALAMQQPADAAIGKALDAELELAKEGRDAKRALSKEERDAARDLAKEGRTAERDAAKHADSEAQQGRADAEKKWKEEGLYKVTEARKAAEQIIEMLNDKNPLNDSQIAHLFVKLKGSIGPQSDKEIDAVFGTSDMPIDAKLYELVRNWFSGGKGEPMRQALIDITTRSVEMDEDRVFKWLDAADQVLSSPTTPDVKKRGWREFRDSVDKDLRDAWDDDRRKQGLPTYEEQEKDRSAAPPAPVPGAIPVSAPMGASSGGGGLERDPAFVAALEESAGKAGINASFLLPLLNYESTGDPHAKNPNSSARGIIQMLDEVAQGYGFKDSAELAALPASEQVPYAVKYLTDRGVTKDSDAGDMYVAIAAPAALDKGDDYVAYRKGSDEYKLNPSWDLDGDGKITRAELYQIGMNKWRRSDYDKAASGASPEKKPEAKPANDDAELLEGI